jgi:ABC-type glycerol-3-phosphate transport system substrate-binding protein
VLRQKIWILTSVMLIAAMLTVACAQATPQTIIQTVEVEKKVIETQVVTVEKTVEVPKEVQVTKEVVVTKEVMVNSTPITYNSYNGDPKPRAFDEAIVKVWNEAHPDQPVEQSIIAHEDFKQAIRAYLTAEPAPDVLTWFAGNRARFFMDKNLIYNFQKQWDDAKMADVMAPGFQALASYKDGKYFMPTSYYWWAIYYRKSLFEKAGIAKPPETWDELLTACDKLNAIGVAPIAMGARFKWPAAAWFDYINMRTNGPQFHIDLMDLKESYTDPRVAKVFEHWKELLDHKCFMKDVAAYDWQEAIDPMVQDKAGMYLMGQFIKDSYPKDKQDDLDFFRFPVIDPAQKIGEDAPTDGFFMSSNATNPDGGAAFLMYLASKEVQEKALAEMGRLPTRTDVDLSKVPADVQQGIKLIQGADYIAQFYDRDTTPPMAEAGMEAFMKFLDDPSQIAKLLQQLEDERQRLLQEASASGG